MIKVFKEKPPSLPSSSHGLERNICIKKKKKKKKKQNKKETRMKKIRGK